MRPFSLFELCDEGSYSIVFYCKPFMGGYCGGSFNVIAARVLGLSYPDYLRYMRDKYGATIKGLQGYSNIIFKDQSKCLLAVQELNNNWKKIEPVLQSLLEKFKNNDCVGVVSEKKIINGKEKEIRKIEC